MLLALLSVLCILLVLYGRLAPRGVPWASQLTRLNAGLGAAEWLAPPQVIEQVICDYQTAQDWQVMCAPNWGRFVEGLDRYTTGAYLKYQQRALASLVGHEPRVAVEQAAAHQIEIRYFTADGLWCLLIDRQTARSLTTSNYWTGRVLHKQHLQDAALVYQMAYDLHDRRWKIGRLIQELPLGTYWGAAAGRSARVIVAADLPTVIGRDA